jgi:hypothetical protein
MHNLNWFYYFIILVHYLKDIHTETNFNTINVYISLTMYCNIYVSFETDFAFCNSEVSVS